METNKYYKYYEQLKNTLYTLKVDLTDKDLKQFGEQIRLSSRKNLTVKDFYIIMINTFTTNEIASKILKEATITSYNQLYHYIILDEFEAKRPKRPKAIFNRFKEFYNLINTFYKKEK